MNIFRVHLNMGRVPPPFWQNMQLQNEFPNSCFARILDWEGGVTLNHGNRRWATAWTQSATEMTFSWVKSTFNLLQYIVNFFLSLFQMIHMVPHWGTRERIG